MTEKRVAYLVISISSLSLWDLLFYYNLFSPKILTAMVVLSVLVFVYSVSKLLLDYKLESKYFKFFLSVFLFYQFILILRGWSFQYKDIKNFIQVSYLFWPFVIPLFVFFDKKLSTIGYLIKWIYFSGLFFLLLFIVDPKLLMERVTAENLVSSIYVSGFILLNARYIKDKKVTVTFFLVTISLLSMVYVARRNGVVTLAGFVVAGYLINMWYKSRTFVYKFFPLFACGTILLMLTLSSFTTNLSAKLQARISEDTRSTLYKMFFVEIDNYKIVGKGMNGEYYYPMEEEVRSDITETAVVYRHIIENGFLQLLLTGGIVHIVLFVLILLPAALLGIFRSNNQFTMACGAVIFLWILDMFVYGLPRLSLHYILVWICVGICFRPSIRNMTNDEIDTQLEVVSL